MVSVAGWATVGDFWLRIDDPAPATTFEWVKVTSVNVAGNQVTVARGENGTTGIAHNAGAFVGNKIPAIALPWGVLGRGQVVTPQLGITTVLTDITNLSAPVVLGANRLIRISLQLSHAGGAGDVLTIQIRDGSNNVIYSTQAITQSAEAIDGFWSTLLVAPAAGAITYKVSMVRFSGTGSEQTECSSTRPGLLLVEDLGPA